jgi:hypothetical protein
MPDDIHTAVPAVTSPQTALYAALAKAQAHARGVEKDSTNTFHRYKYASAESLIAEAKDCLSVAGLAVLPISSVVTPLERSLGDTTSKDGKVSVGAIAKLLAKWLVVHAEGGSLELSIEWPVVPESGRPIDKAVASAHTASLGYLLRDLLQLPRVEEGTDMDGDDRDASHSEEQKRQAERVAKMEADKKRAQEAATKKTAPPADDEMRIKTAVQVELVRLGVTDRAAQAAEVKRLFGGIVPTAVADWRALLENIKKLTTIEPAKAAPTDRAAALDALASAP